VAALRGSAGTVVPSLCARAWSTRLCGSGIRAKLVGRGGSVTR
jgi:hypothetical protein